MLKVGLTGNIASGKSSVARVWRRLGAVVIDADVLARRAVEPGTPGLAQIVDEWGERMLDPDGSLDRAALREVVFRDTAAREKLESIVHPQVGALRDGEVAKAIASGEKLVVADIPLLFEVAMQDEFDVVVFVDAPETARFRRLVDLRGLDPEEAQRMIDAQMDPAEKRPLADIIIENDGTMLDLEAHARRIWRQLLQRAGQGTDR